MKSTLLRQRVRRIVRPAALGLVRGTEPLSSRWGSDRGTPIDRYYIEHFLARHAAGIRGSVLEVRDARYTERYGTEIVRSDILDIDASNPRATIIADLARADAVPSEHYDCVILTQTLQFIFDPAAALAHAHRILRPGGVLLATAPVTSRIDPCYGDGEYWRFTPKGCDRLVRDAFQAGEVDVATYGNVRSSIAFLAGLAAEELDRKVLDRYDPRFPLLVAVRARKRCNPGARMMAPFAPTLEMESAPEIPATPEARVSVIMPIFNAARFLAEAIESVLAQTYRAWELLLVDDGSTDGSTEIALAYAARYAGRIRYLSHPDRENRGASAARNVGIRHARGEFLAFLDADDVYLPTKLEQQIPLLEARPEVGMLYGNTRFWHEWRDERAGGERDFLPPLGVPTDTVVQPAELLRRYIRGAAAVPCTCSVLLRREIAERVGGFEECFPGMFDDQAFYAKILLSTPVYVSSLVLEKYRIHPDSTYRSAKREGSVHRTRSTYLEWLARYLEAHAGGERALRRDVQWQRWLTRRPHLQRTLARAQGSVAALRRRVSTALSESLRQRVRRFARPLGGARFGNLRRVTPLSRHFGYERGQPVDRYYIEAFLARHSADIRGRVLEIGDDSYTRRFGGERVAVLDVLHVSPDAPGATIVDDLASGERIPSDAFDCVILTQTLHLIFELRAAVATIHRILRPGGVLLLTAPGISQLHAGQWKDTWFWSFTPASLDRLFVERFPGTAVQIGTYGNVLAACAFLQGLARQELRAGELDASDPLYPLLITLRAQKPEGTSSHAETVELEVEG